MLCKGLTWGVPIISMTTSNIHKKQIFSLNNMRTQVPKHPFKIHFLLHVTINRPLQIPENTSCSTPYVILYAQKKSKEPTAYAIKEDVDEVMVRTALLFYSVMSSHNHKHTQTLSSRPHLYGE